MVSEHINKTIELINGSKFYYGFDKYSRIYFNNTENIKGTQDSLNINKGSRVLTTTGSSEQALNAIFHGATLVDAFDLNILSGYFLDFKIAAVLSLDYEEYLEFMKLFSLNYKHEYVRENYLKIRKNMPKDTKDYWDNVLFFRLKDYRKNISIIKELFTSFLSDKDLMERCDFLSNEDNYNILKNNLGNCLIRFINCDVNCLTQIINNKYDLIYLSNIADYISTSKEGLIPFRDYLKNDLYNYLSDSGELVAAYLYCLNSINNIRPIELAGVREELFTDFEIRSFKGVYKDTNIIHGDTDGIMVLKR